MLAIPATSATMNPTTMNARMVSPTTQSIVATKRQIARSRAPMSLVKLRRERMRAQIRALEVFDAFQERRRRIAKGPGNHRVLRGRVGVETVQISARIQ